MAAASLEQILKKAGGALRPSSKTSPVTQNAAQMPSSNIAPRTESPFTTKYESRGIWYACKQSYKDGFEKGRLKWTKPWAYEVLPKGEVRLLELLPGSAGRFIECRLHQGLLDNLPRYEALSYTWGDNSEPDLPVFIDGKAFLVKDNLKLALRRFSPSSREGSAADSAEGFLRLWERICLLIDRPGRSSSFISKAAAEVVRAVGEQGQADYEKYRRLVEEGAAQSPETSKSQDNKTEKEIKSLLAGLEARRQEIQDLWKMHATEEGKARVAINSRFLWIDAICINQADSDERVEQIKLMLQIYHKAQSVLIWLGDDDGDGGAAIQLLTLLGQMTQKGKEERLMMPFVFDDFDKSTPWYSLAFFFSAPWFRRSWVVQEYIAGKLGRGSPIFYYGPRSIPSAYLDNLTWSVPLFDEVIRGKVVESWALHPRRYSWGGVGARFEKGLVEWAKLSTSLMHTSASDTEAAPVTSPKFIYWLMRIRNRQATNPLDKIYSVLGLVGDINGEKEPDDVLLEALIVDYKASVQDVYSSVVRAVVLKTRKLQILGACTRRSPEIQRTWTPDWTQPREYDLFSVDLMLDGVNISGFDSVTGFCASAQLDCQTVFADDLSTLVAKGILWDQISSKTNIVDIKDPQEYQKLISGHVPQGLAKELLNIWDFLIDGDVYPDEDAPSKAMWGTLMVQSALYSEEERLFEDSPPPILWVQPLRDILDGKESSIFNSPLSLTRQLTSANLETSEDIISNLKKAIFQSIFDEVAVVTTEKGYIGRGTNKCQVGDLVCILLGCNLPVILRPVDGHYEFIREIYLHGVMHGEAIQAMEEGKVQLQSFELH